MNLCPLFTRGGLRYKATLVGLAGMLATILNSAAAEAITRIGSWPGYTRRAPVEVSGDGATAYLVGTTGLQIFDLSSPSQPEALSFLPCLELTEAPADLHVQSESNRLCIGVANPNQVKGIDVSILTNPVQVWDGGLYAQPNQVCLNGARVYSSHATLGMSISFWGTSGYGTRYGSIPAFGRVVVVGNRIYSPTASGFQIFDKSDLDPPVGTFDAGIRVNALAVEGQYAYLAAVDGLRIVDLQNETAPTQVGFLQTAPSVREATGIELPPGQSHAYLTFKGTNTLLVVNVATASSPAWAGGYEFAGPITDYSVSDGSAFVLARNNPSSGSADLQVLNLADPGNPTLQTRLYANGFTRQLALQEGALFLADGDNGMCVLDTATPSAFQIISHQLSGGAVTCVAAANDRAFLGTGSGFSAFDVSDPGNPGLITNSWEPAYQMESVGDYLYRIGGYGMPELVINDASNNFAEVERKFFIEGINQVGAFSMASNQFALLVDGWQGNLVVIDAETAGLPVVTNYQNGPTIVDVDGQVDGSGTNAFLATTNGLVILDLRDMQSVGQWDCPPGIEPNCICVSGDRIALASTNHLWVLDRNALGGGDAVIAETAITNSFSDMILSGNSLYAAAGSDCVIVYQIGATPAQPSLFITKNLLDEVTLEWGAAGTGWFLQQSQEPGNPASWATVTGSDAMTSTNLPLTVPAQFFRLKQP